MSRRVLAGGGAALFGKLPCRGDFVARGFPAGLRGALDRWLTVHLARRAAADWPEGGLRATLTLGGASLTALILPSRDRAGRAFPLAACRLPGLPRGAAE
ncbi:type VI secretion system-associated protein TagF, partial [Rhodovulum iodosum]